MVYSIKKLDKKLELIKALHKPIMKIQLMDLIASINEYEDSKERTLRNYNSEGDIKIGNVIIPFKIQKIRNRRTLSNSERTSSDVKAFDLMERSSVHPVILPLNLTEVHYLTNVILDKLGRSHPDYEIYKGIANKIYSQLSDYGKEKINNHGHNFEKLETVTYDRECDMAGKNHRFALAMAEKSNDRAKVILFDDQCFEGEILFEKDDFYLKKDNGEKILIDNLGIKKVEYVK